MRQKKVWREARRWWCLLFPLSFSHSPLFSRLFPCAPSSPLRLLDFFPLAGLIHSQTSKHPHTCSTLGSWNRPAGAWEEHHSVLSLSCPPLGKCRRPLQEMGSASAKQTPWVWPVTALYIQQLCYHFFCKGKPRMQGKLVDTCSSYTSLPFCPALLKILRAGFWMFL